MSVRTQTGVSWTQCRLVVVRYAWMRPRDEDDRGHDEHDRHAARVWRVLPVPDLPTRQARVPGKGTAGGWGR